MKRAIVLVLIVAACKAKPRALRHTVPAAEDASTLVSEAPPPPRHDPASQRARDTVDPSLLSGATTVRGDALAAVDATAAGPAPALTLIQRLGPTTAGSRSFDLVLLVGGAHATALELGTYRESILPDPTSAPDGTLLRIPPIDPPRPWQLDDGGFGEAPLPAAGNVHFAYRTHIPGEADTFAVYETAPDHLAIGHLHTTNSDPGHPTWSQLAMITVAR